MKEERYSEFPYLSKWDSFKLALIFGLGFAIVVIF